MHQIIFSIGDRKVSYQANDSSVAASWINHWYSVDPVSNTHRQFGPQTLAQQGDYLKLTTWIAQPEDHQLTPVHSYQWPLFQQQHRHGDLTMGWHSHLPELRRVYHLRDVAAVRQGLFETVTAITPEISLHFGDDPAQADFFHLKRDILWWLYENDLVGHIPRMSFELLCHGDPVIGRLFHPHWSEVKQLLLQGERITEMRIYPLACF